MKIKNVLNILLSNINPNWNLFLFIIVVISILVVLIFAFLIFIIIRGNKKESKPDDKINILKKYVSELQVKWLIIILKKYQLVCLINFRKKYFVIRN